MEDGVDLPKRARNNDRKQNKNEEVTADLLFMDWLCPQCRRVPMVDVFRGSVMGIKTQFCWQCLTRPKAFWHDDLIWNLAIWLHAMTSPSLPLSLLYLSSTLSPNSNPKHLLFPWLLSSPSDQWETGCTYMLSEASME